MIVSTIQRNLTCDCDSVGQGPGTLPQSSPRPGGSWGDDKYLLYVDQAVVVTMIISAVSAGVMLHRGRRQQQAGLPHFLMAGEASGKQMLSDDEQRRPGWGWAFSPDSEQSKHQFWVAGVRARLSVVLSLQSKALDR